MEYSFTITREDWSLHRKGEVDQQRHREKVRDAIKKNLADIVTEESIILSDGHRVVKVPIRSLEQYRFRYDSRKQKHAGQGEGKSKVGDILGSDTESATGKGPGAGELPGHDYYEAEVTIDEVANILFNDLSLPNLEEKKNKKLASETVEFRDVRKHGIQSNIDRKRTILEVLKRNALKGEPGLHGITPEDLRYKTWEVTPKYESSAVVLAMMDTSGSREVLN